MGSWRVRGSLLSSLVALKVVISKKRVFLLFSLQTEQILWRRRNPEPGAANVHGCHHLKPKLCRNRLVEPQHQQLDSNQTVTPEKRFYLVGFGGSFGGEGFGQLQYETLPLDDTTPDSWCVRFTSKFIVRSDFTYQLTTFQLQLDKREGRLRYCS